jgi:hypothetical protein
MLTAPRSTLPVQESCLLAVLPDRRSEKQASNQPGSQHDPLVESRTPSVKLSFNRRPSM